MKEGGAALEVLKDVSLHLCICSALNLGQNPAPDGQSRFVE